MSEEQLVVAAAQEATGTVASDDAHDAQAAEPVYVPPAGQLQPAAVVLPPGIVGNYDETADVFDGVHWQEAGGAPLCLALPCHTTMIPPASSHARQDVPALTPRQKAEMAAERVAAELLAEEEQDRAARAAAPAVARPRKGKGSARRRRK